MAMTLNAEDRQWLMDYVHESIRWGNTTPSTTGVTAPSIAMNERSLTWISDILTDDVLVYLPRIEATLARMEGKLDQLLAS